MEAYYALAVIIIIAAGFITVGGVFLAHGPQPPAEPKNTDGYYTRNEQAKREFSEQVKTDPYRVIGGGELENLDGTSGRVRYNR